MLQGKGLVTILPIQSLAFQPTSDYELVKVDGRGRINQFLENQWALT